MVQWQSKSMSSQLSSSPPAPSTRYHLHVYSRLVLFPRRRGDGEIIKSSQPQPYSLRLHYGRFLSETAVCSCCLCARCRPKRLLTQVRGRAESQSFESKRTRNNTGNTWLVPVYRAQCTSAIISSAQKHCVFLVVLFFVSCEMRTAERSTLVPVRRYTYGTR